MIVHRQRPHVRLLLLAIAGAILALLGGLAGVAHAESPWGELTRTPLSVGAGEGEIDLSHENISGYDTVAVDPTDGAFYVGEQIAAEQKPEFRIQRFGPEGKLQASITFATREEGTSLTEHTAEGMELAVDPARGRVYALIIYKRRPQSEAESIAGENECEEKPTECYEHIPLDAEERAAAELYAFDYTGSKLVGAKLKKEPGGEEVPAPIVVQSAFKTQKEEPREALLDPRGVAVEPATGDLAITGEEDLQENLKVEKGEAEKECRATVQLIDVKEEASKKELSGKVGPRYVDEGSVLEAKTCGAEESEASVPFSPVFTAGGKLLAEETGLQDLPHWGEVWELPLSGTKLTTTTKVEEFAATPRQLYSLGEQQELVNVEAEGLGNAAMSFVPTGSGEGKLYLATKIKGGSGEGENAGVLVLGYNETGATPEAKELGWTGGGHEAGGGGEGCVIPSPNAGAIMVGGFKEETAGGKEGVVAFDVFAHQSNNKSEKRVEAFQFGPGSSKAGECPHASAAALGVKVKGVEVHRLAPGEKATLASKLTAGNAESVEWKLENLSTGKTTTETGGYEFGETSLEHSFSEEGKYQIVEVIQTDNLASPKVEATRDLTVKPPGPEFMISGPTSVAKEEQEATFEAEVTDEDAKASPLKYVWSFGDGATEEGQVEVKGGVATILGRHHYGSLCAPCTVTLQATDAEGRTGQASATITVHEDKAEEEARRLREESERKQREEAERRQHEAEERARKEAEEKKLKEEQEHNKKPEVAPEVTLSGSSLAASPQGAVTIKVACPAGDTSCSGTVTLRTVGATSAAHGKKHKNKPASVTLASGSFSVTGGHVVAVTLHLSAQGRSMLKRLHVLRVQAVVVAHDPSGASHTTQTTVTLRVATKSSHGHSRKH